MDVKIGISSYESVEMRLSRLNKIYVFLIQEIDLMTRLGILFFFMALCFTSCGKKTESEQVPEYVNQQEQVPTLKSDAPVVALNRESEELVKDWGEYQDFSQLIVQYREISKSDALLNSVELEELARYLKDSVRVKKLDIPSVRMRLNVLHNEVQRLADMSTIPTITWEEVLEENNNVLDAYASLNIKINDLGNQERINRELAKFDDAPEVETDTAPPPEESPEKKILKQVN